MVLIYILKFIGKDQEYRQIKNLDFIAFKLMYTFTKDIIIETLKK